MGFLPIPFPISRLRARTPDRNAYKTILPLPGKAKLLSNISDQLGTTFPFTVDGHVIFDPLAILIRHEGLLLAASTPIRKIV
jgi:hypothetical protein